MYATHSQPSHRKLGVGKGGEWKPLSFMYGEEFAPLT